jgi:hypothetical protein
LLPIALLAMPMRLPLASIAQAEVLMLSTLMWMLAMSSGVLVLASVFHLLDFQLEFLSTEVVAMSGMFLVPQAVYSLFVAELVRCQRASVIFRSRLILGLCSLAFTLVACVFVGSGPSLLWATTFAFIVADCYLVGSAQPLRIIRAYERLDSSLGLGTVRDGWRLSVATVANSMAALAPAFILGTLGSSAGAWAVSLRVVSGFQTVGLQLLGPAIDMSVVKAARVGPASLDRTLFRSSVAASGLGLLASIAVGCALLFSKSRSPEFFLDASMISASMLFAIGAAGLPPIDRIPGILGLERFRIWWDIARLLMTFAMIVFLDPATLLLTLGVLTTMSLPLYAQLVTRLARSQVGRMAVEVCVRE